MTQQINLYDPRLRRRRDLLSLTNVALGAVALLVCIIGIGAITRVSAARSESEARTLEPQAKGLQEQLTTLAKLASARKPDPLLEQELASTQGQLAARNEMLALLQKGLGPQATAFSEYLRGFARQTPPGLWLVGFSVDGDGSGMKIEGRTTDPALVPAYIRRLNGEKAFQGRAFASLQLGVPAPPPGSNVQAPVVPRYHEFTLEPAAGGVAGPGGADNPGPLAHAAQLLPVDAAKALSDAGKVMGAGTP